MVEFIVITITNALWLFYSMFEGMREALFRNYEKISKRNIDIDTNLIFNTQRILVLLSIGSISAYMIGLFSIPIIIGQLFMFKYFHKISYKCTIKKLKKDNLEEEKNKEKKEKLVFYGVLIQVLAYLLM
jgi:hypothetical protein